MTPSASGQKYELMLAFVPTLTEKEIEKELSSIKKLIEKKGAVIHEQVWGKRDLYYKIKKYDKGIYALLHFTFPESTQSLRRELQLMHHLMRFLLLILPTHYQMGPFATLEEPVTEKKEEKKERVKRVKKVAEKPELKKEVKKEEITAKEVSAEPEETKDTSKKKKSTFDEKIDEIIENLDNL